MSPEENAETVVGSSRSVSAEYVAPHLSLHGRALVGEIFAKFRTEIGNAAARLRSAQALAEVLRQLGQTDPSQPERDTIVWTEREIGRCSSHLEKIKQIFYQLNPGGTEP